jgi:hypothetical protein
MVNHQAQAQPTSAAGRAQQEASTVDRSVLPAADSPFRGRIEVAFKDSTADWPEPLKAPEGAPNVLLIMGDDIGYGHMSAFGGPANTPVFDRLAAPGGVGEGRIDKTVPVYFSTDDTFDVGEDWGTPVSATYKPPFRFTGTLKKVTLEAK